MTLYCLNCEKGIYELPKTELNAYGPLAITNEEKYCNMELKKLGTGEWIMGENPAPFNDYQRLKGKSNAIINQITNMLSLQYVEKLEEELIDLLNMIKEDDYIGQLSRLSEKFFCPGYQFIMNNFNIYFSNFATKWWRLQMINVTPLICTYEDATEESVNECKARYEALKEQYPESFAFMEAFNIHNQ